MPLRGEGSCGGGGAPRDSAGSGATEEGLITFGFTHSFLLTVMGYDRYVAICHPLRYNVLMSTRDCARLVSWCWAGGSVMGLGTAPASTPPPTSRLGARAQFGEEK